MFKVVISGYYGFGNSGDEAILKTIIKDLRALESSLDITVLSVNPKLTQGQYNVKAINRFNIHQVISTIKNCDMLISGGGSLLQDITSTRSLLYYLFIIRVALHYRKKIMLYANGVGPVNSDHNRNRIKKVINQVGLITLREEQSLKLLREIGIDRPKLLLTADPVLNFEAADQSRVSEIFTMESIPKDKKLAAINIREWKLAGSFEEQIAKSADYMMEKYNLASLFVPMFTSDIDIIKRIRKLMKHDSYMLSKCYEPEIIAGILSKTDIVIAMRLHTLIYASISSIPMIGLAYDPKINGYLEYISQTSVGNIQSFDAAHINEAIDIVMKNYDEYKHKLNDIVSNLKIKAKENALIALEYLKS